jgi:lipid-binding SYLF domain-containing protein
MINVRGLFLAAALALTAAGSSGALNPAHAASAEEIDRDSQRALQKLYDTNPAAAAIGKQARAVLIFPNIVKAGLVIGGAYGEGELIRHSHVVGYYSTGTASWGLQAGAQAYGYAVFLMTKKAENYVHSTKGWEIGVGPTVVVVDAGVARNLSTSTLKDDAYAFIFDQKGLMAGVSIEGSKVTRIKK